MMGIVKNIDYNKFPKQGKWQNLRCQVCFHYGNEILNGTIVRDDIESPHITIIQLDDGRFILSTECQFRPQSTR